MNNKHLKKNDKNQRTPYLICQVYVQSYGCMISEDIVQKTPARNILHKYADSQLLSPCLFSNVCILENILNVFLHKYALSTCSFPKINGVSQSKASPHLLERKNTMELAIARLYFILYAPVRDKNKNQTKPKQHKISRIQAQLR